MMARSATNAPASQKPGGGSKLWMLGLASGAVATLATPTAVMAAVLLAPCIILGMLDTRPGRPALRPVLLCGLAATLNPLLALWHSGHTIQSCLALLGDSSVISTAWAAQAAGWLLAELAPVGIRLVLESQCFARAAALRMQRRKFEEDWGVPPASDLPAAPEPTGSAKQQT